MRSHKESPGVQQSYFVMSELLGGGTEPKVQGQSHTLFSVSSEIFYIHESGCGFRRCVPTQSVLKPLKLFQSPLYS